MGFHADKLGYESAEKMGLFFWDEQEQLEAMVRFIATEPALARAVRIRDFREFARLYNGSGQVDRYADLLEKRYAMYVGGMTETV